MLLKSKIPKCIIYDIKISSNFNRESSDGENFNEENFCWKNFVKGSSDEEGLEEKNSKNINITHIKS